MSQVGASLLIETVQTGAWMTRSGGLCHRGRSPLAWHDPAKDLLDQVVSLVTGGNCLADVDRFRDPPGGLIGPVAPASTITRLLSRLVDNNANVLAAINQAHSQIRTIVWEVLGQHQRSQEYPLMSR